MAEKKKQTNNDALEKELEEITSPPGKKLVERIDKDTLALNGSKYEVVTDHKEALDLEILEARYSELLEKYDYIVGDISYDKLRLRGFYEDHAKKVPIDMRISSLDDYLLEYCSFGCKYFVLKRLDPKKKLPPEFESNTKRSNKRRSRRSSRRSSGRQRSSQSKKQSSGSNKSSNKRDFKKKEVSHSETKEKKDANVQTVKDKKGNTRFQIRRKKKEANQ